MRYRKLKVHNIVLESTRLRLRPLGEADWDLLMKWNNDPAVLYYSEGEDIKSWALKDLQQMYRGVSRRAFMFIMELKEGGEGFSGGGRPIGDIWLQEMNIDYWRRKYPRRDLRRLPIFIGEKAEWGQGYGSEAIRLLSGFAFADGAEMLFACGIADFNFRSRRAFEKNGFRMVRKVRCRGKGLWEYDMMRRRESPPL